jgi:hypothetical protein
MRTIIPPVPVQERARKKAEQQAEQTPNPHRERGRQHETAAGRLQAGWGKEGHGTKIYKQTNAYGISPAGNPTA